MNPIDLGNQVHPASHSGAEPRYRILMADDVQRYHALYERAITEALPATVHFALNGEEALKRLDSPTPYDLLILDLNMPRLNGEEALRRIRQDPTYDTMPVIILTGDTDHETHRRLLDAGADDFIEKGASPDIFVARLRAQLRHRSALDRLSGAAADMDIFAAGVLHDIRNLETNVLTVCELARVYLDEDPVGRAPTVIEDMRNLEERADNLGRYAAGILDSVRETSRPLDPKPLNPAPVIAWCVRLAQPVGTEIPPLVCHLPGALSEVLADERFLKLAVLNIVQNAVKYRRPGSTPTVSVSERPGRLDPASPGAPPAVVLVLRDHGVGIPAPEMRRVFEPFVRGSTWRKKEGGYGLGLSLVRKVVTAMGGRVWAEPPVDGGAGTAFCLELRRAPSTGTGGAGRPEGG